jgi:hypothetical protein
MFYSVAELMNSHITTIAQYDDVKVVGLSISTDAADNIFSVESWI